MINIAITIAMLFTGIYAISLLFNMIRPGNLFDYVLFLISVIIVAGGGIVIHGLLTSFSDVCDNIEISFKNNDN